MAKESGWVAVAIGASVGVLGWVVGLGKVLWPDHPHWALFFVIAGVIGISMMIVERSERRSAHAEN